ncbi:MAG: hypothetical protein GY730_07480 [bacterium]|nr:hypothetical protein [bacterium]
MNLLIVSNGYGEDQIACNLIRAIKDCYEKTAIDAMPLVGDGQEYRNLGIIPVVKNIKLPSGGFVRNVFDFMKDLRGGLLKQILRHITFVKNSNKEYSVTICVGDVYCLAAGSFFNRSVKYFLPTAKSDSFMKHGWLEKKIIKRLAKKTFPRDQGTSDTLVKAGISSIYLGNPVMDALFTANDKLDDFIKDTVIGILPGSREEAYNNIDYIVSLISYFEQQTDMKSLNVKYILGKSKQINSRKIESIAEKHNWFIVKEGSRTYLENPVLPNKILITEDFTSVLKVSSIIIGQAGTANEQAVYSGVPVICFEGHGPQSTRQRFLEQKRLLGDLLFFIEDNSPEHISEVILDNLKRDFVKHPENSGITGRSSDKIIREIFKDIY